MDVSPIFGIIFTIIVMVFLLVFGLMYNPGPIEEEAQLGRTIKMLGERIDNIYRNAEGSRTEFMLSFSKNYRLCFFNSSNPESRFYSDSSMTWDPDQTVKFRINQSGYNSWYYKGEDNAAGYGYSFSYLAMPTEKNFCAIGGSKIYLVNRGIGVEVSAA
jgi:hypothetical protein